MRKLVLVSSLILLGACAKHDSAQPTSPDTLANKPPAEVLGEKYEKSVLTCNLWSERSLDGEVRNSAVDSVRIDLKRPSSVAGSYTLKFSNNEHLFKMTLNLLEPNVLAALTLNTGRKQYVMRNTVTVPFTYSYKSFTRITRDQSVNGAGERTYADSIYERVPYLVVQASGSAEPEGRIRQGGYTDKVGCLLETKINPAYAGDYTEVSN